MELDKMKRVTTVTRIRKKRTKRSLSMMMNSSTDLGARSGYISIEWMTRMMMVVMQMKIKMI